MYIFRSVQLLAYFFHSKGGGASEGPVEYTPAKIILLIGADF